MWKSEYDAYIDKEDNCFYLMPNKNTNYSNLTKECFEKKGDMDVKMLS